VCAEELCVTEERAVPKAERVLVTESRKWCGWS
jgi:hypothetical protein